VALTPFDPCRVVIFHAAASGGDAPGYQIYPLRGFLEARARALMRVGAGIRAAGGPSRAIEKVLVLRLVLAFHDQEASFVVKDDGADVAAEGMDFFFGLELHLCNRFQRLRERFEPFVNGHRRPL